MSPHLLPGHNGCWQGGKKKQIASPDWPKVKGKSPSKLPVWDIKKCVESSSNLQRKMLDGWLHLKSWHQDLRWDMFVTFLLVEKFLTEEHILTAEFEWSKMDGLEICSHDLEVLRCTPPKTNMAKWRITILGMRYIFKWFCFHCHVRFRWFYSCARFVYQRGKRYLFRHYDISPRLKMGLRPARMAHQNLIGPHWKPRNARNKGISLPSEELIRCFVSHVGFQSRLNLKPSIFFSLTCGKKTIHILPKSLSKKRSPKWWISSPPSWKPSFFVPIGFRFPAGQRTKFPFPSCVDHGWKDDDIPGEKKKGSKKEYLEDHFSVTCFFCCKKHGNSCISDDCRWSGLHMSTPSTY